jgi:hypothetical protein
MNSGRDPFGFKSRKRSVPPSQPLTVIARPGQEVRIVVPDSQSGGPASIGDTRVSPKPSGDTRVSPKPSGDTRVSPKPSGDAAGNPFAFTRYQPQYSPTPITIVAQSGQEIRIVVPDDSGRIAGFPGDTRVSPKPSGDTRVSPRPSGDSRAPN